MRPVLIYIFTWLAVMSSVRAEISDASVTMPYSELSLLLEKLTSKEAVSELPEEPPKPPVDVLVRRASYQVACERLGEVAFTGCFEVSNLSDAWQSVPLVGLDRSLESVEPEDALILEENGMWHLLIEPQSDLDVVLNFMPIATSVVGGVRSVVRFQAAEAASHSLSVEGDFDGGELAVHGSVGTNVGMRTYGLPAAGGVVEVKHYDALRVVNARWGARAQYFVLKESTEFEVYCGLWLDALNDGRTSSAELSLPKGATFLSARGEHLQQSTYAERSKAGTLIELNWMDDVSARRFVEIKYTVPADSDVGVWTLAGIASDAFEQFKEFYYIGEMEGLRVTPLSDDRAIAERLPEWMEPHASANGNVWFVELEETDSLKVQVDSLPRIETPSATIVSAECVTEFVEGGSSLVESIVRI